MTDISLQHILDNAGHGLRVIDKDFTVCLINHSFAELSGITAEEAVGKKCWQVFKGPFCKTPGCRLKRIIEGKEVLRAEIVRTKRDGKPVPCIVTASAIRTKDGELFGIAEMFSDITEHKQLHKALQKSETLYRTVFETTVTATSILDRDGTILRVNREWERLYGYSKAEVQGQKKFLEFCLRDEVERMDGYFRERVTDPSSVPAVYETSIIDKQGNTKFTS